MRHNKLQPATAEAKALLKAADTDLKTVKLLLLHSDAPISSICFHTQQYLEKAIKAVLVSNGVIFSRTHDLEELVNLLLKNKITLSIPNDHLKNLNPFAVIYRYEEIEIPKIEIQTIIEILDQTCLWINEQLIV
jgi:HEPN domain-containing protein